jgi:hypothetical protein
MLRVNTCKNYNGREENNWTDAGEIREKKLIVVIQTLQSK